MPSFESSEPGVIAIKIEPAVAARTQSRIARRRHLEQMPKWRPCYLTEVNLDGS